ncbi:MAG: MFS transporter [Chloroflexi bacterium]|nr:MFS transporter [Chloroflexota bacterium]
MALTLLPSNIPAAAIPLLASEWGASNAALGWVVGAHLLGYSVAVLIVLPLTDRLGPRPIVVTGALVAGVASLALPIFAHDVTVAVLTRLAAGVGLAGVYMPGVRIIATTVDARSRGAAVGAFVAAFYAGSSLSFLYAGLVIGPGAGWREAALTSAALACLAPILALPASRGVAAARARGVLAIGVIRDGPLFRTIAAYSGHAWELFAMRGWLAAFLAAALVAQGASAIERRRRPDAGRRSSSARAFPRSSSGRGSRIASAARAPRSRSASRAARSASCTAGSAVSPGRCSSPSASRTARSSRPIRRCTRPA